MNLRLKRNRRLPTKHTKTHETVSLNPNRDYPLTGLSCYFVYLVGKNFSEEWSR